jgi:flavin-binding protein dodecin
VFAVFNMDQLSAIAAGDVGNNKILHRLLFRVGVIVGTARQPNADAPVDFTVGAVNVVNDMVRDQDIAIVNGDVPFYRVTLQVAKVTIGDRAPII